MGGFYPTEKQQENAKEASKRTRRRKRELAETPEIDWDAAIARLRKMLNK